MFLPQRARNVIELGCGSGSFGKVLRQNYPEACIIGVEINPQAAEKARPVYDTVHISDVNDVLSATTPGLFDLIVCNDILEHLTDPWKCLNLAKNCLASDGVVVASIPNMRFWPVLSDLLFNKAWNYRDAGVMDRTHLRFFTESSIHRLFVDCGYVVDTLEGISRTSRISLRWRLLNALMAGRLFDCVYPQFAVVAGPLEASEALRE